MRVAAYQIPLTVCQSPDVVLRIAAKVRWCESHGVQVLCCPEGALGGLADYAPFPADIALNVENGELLTRLRSLASDQVTTILGFTEIGNDGLLYNSAVILHRGTVYGVYRKLHPAINKSVYSAGNQRPVFTLSDLTFGVLLCRDSTFCEPAKTMAEKGATVLFIPTNNGLPRTKAIPQLVYETRACDVKRASENAVFIVRADVAGDSGPLTSLHTTSVTGPDGSLIQAADRDVEQLIVAEVY